jgi:hypothetical protein
MALTAPESGGRSVGIVRWRTKAPEFFSLYIMRNYITEQDVYASDLPNETGWSSVNARLVFARWSLRISAETPASLDLIFRDFSPSF